MSAPSPSPLLVAFAESYHDLVRFVARRTGPQAAQDLVHDAWLRLAERGVQGAAAFEPAADPQQAARQQRSYLYTVAENLTIDHLRRNRRAHERFDADALPEATPAHHATPDVADTHLYRQALTEVERTLAQLPARCRDIFLADRIDGLPHAELASRHGVSVKTVEREVMRALDSVEASLHRWRGEADAPARKGRRRALSALLGVAGMGVGSAALWQAWRQWMPQYAATLATATGRTLVQPLPDGSTLALDARSEVHVRYTALRRGVQLLSGSAFFAVAPDAQRPFEVQAQGVRVTVVGTRFEVALEPDGVRVSVEEGRVRVEDPHGAPLELQAGEQVLLPPQAPAQRSARTGTVAPWRDGWLEFHHTPLGEAVQRLGRYSALPLSVEPDAADLPVLARVRIADARQWLRLLPGSLPVAVREAGGGAIVIARR